MKHAIVITLIVGVLVYGLTAFIKMETSPVAWGEDARMFAAIIWVVVSAFSIAAFYDIKNKNL